MAPRASYLPFEGSTDDADPGVWQPWWYLTPNPRHIANTDLDTDATGRQVPVHVQDQSSFDHASDHYQNLDYFNPWQESPLQAPPDQTTYSARTPGMPVRLDLPMNHPQSHLDPIIANNVQGETLSPRYSTNSQFGFFRHWQEPFPQPVSDISNAEAGTPSQTFVENSPINPTANTNPIDVNCAPQWRSLAENPSEPHLYFDRWQEPSTSNVRIVGPLDPSVGLNNEVSANRYYPEAHEYNFPPFTTDHGQGQVPSQEPASISSHPDYASLWQEPLGPLPAPDIHLSDTSSLTFGLYHYAEHHAEAEARATSALLQADQQSLASSIEWSGQPPSTPIAGSLVNTKDVSLRERRRPGEARFSCTFCPSVFTAKHNYKYHMQAHRGERPHSCDICGTLFGRWSDLKRHKRSKKHHDALQFRSGESSRPMKAT